MTSPSFDQQISPDAATNKLVNHTDSAKVDQSSPSTMENNLENLVDEDIDQIPQSVQHVDRAQVLKSYDNTDWLHSRGARLIRIMAEFMETGDKLTANNVRGSILVFGSARVHSPEQWAEGMADYKKKLDCLTEGTPEYAATHKAMDLLRRTQKLTAHYHPTARLCQLITEWANTAEAEQAIRQSVEMIPFYFDKTPTPSVSTSAQSNAEGWSRSGLLVCTGGGPGMMEAANKGAAGVPGGRTMGMGISLPFEKHLNDYVSPDLGFRYHYFFTRKFWMVYMAMGVVATPGGVGTLDELMEVLTLRQCGRFQRKIPIVMFGKSFWKTVVNFDALLENGVISEDDYSDLFWTDCPEEAFEYIRSTLVSTL